MPDRDREPATAEPEPEPDFADEHSRPTFADEPAPEGPDESVPSGRGGDGGLEPD